MSLQAFVEALFTLAARCSKCPLLPEQMLVLLEVCEAQLESQVPDKPEDRQRSLSCGQTTSQGSTKIPLLLLSPSPSRNNANLYFPATAWRPASQDLSLRKSHHGRTLEN